MQSSLLVYIYKSSYFRAEIPFETWYCMHDQCPMAIIPDRYNSHAISEFGTPYYGAAVQQRRMFTSSSRFAKHAVSNWQRLQLRLTLTELTLSLTN
jgi:hypothetical protein